MTRRLKTRDPDAFPVHIDVRVRFRDLDPFQHLNNGIYLSYFEEARIEYLKRISALEDHIQARGALGTMTESFPSYVIRASLEFRAQAYLHQILRVCVRIDTIRKSFLDFSYSVFDRDTKGFVAEGKTTLLVIDPITLKPIKVPDYIIRSVEQIEGRSLNEGI